MFGYNITGDICILKALLLNFNLAQLLLILNKHHEKHILFF